MYIEQRLENIEHKLDMVLALLQAQPPIAAPSVQIQRKLTLPIPNEKGTALEIMHEDLAEFEHPNYYYRDENGNQVFAVPVQGATTTNAKYPRTEYRYYKPGFKNWDRGEVYEKEIRFAVDQLHRDGKIVIAQAHAVDAPPDYKFVLDGKGRLRILAKTKDNLSKDDVVLVVEEGIDLSPDTIHSLETWYDGQTLKTSFDGKRVDDIIFNKTTQWYPKDGLYNAARYPAQIRQLLD